MDKDFAHRIRQAREALGLTREQLANTLHVTYQAVQAWEQGVKPRARRWDDIADALHISVPELFLGKEEGTPSTPPPDDAEPGFPERLRDLRTAQNLSMQELAERTSVSWQAVQGWEDGSDFPHVAKWSAIAQALSTNVSVLFYGKTDPQRAGRQRSDKVAQLIAAFLACDPEDQAWLLEGAARLARQ